MGWGQWGGLAAACWTLCMDVRQMARQAECHTAEQHNRRSLHTGCAIGTRVCIHTGWSLVTALRTKACSLACRPTRNMRRGSRHHSHGQALGVATHNWPTALRVCRKKAGRRRHHSQEEDACTATTTLAGPNSRSFKYESPNSGGACLRARQGLSQPHHTQNTARVQAEVTGPAQHSTAQLTACRPAQTRPPSCCCLAQLARATSWATWPCRSTRLAG